MATEHDNAPRTEISVRDGSEYFRGLLLLLRMDRKVAPAEVELARRIGSRLGFEKEFCETAIRDILENAYVADTAPRFSDPALAGKFLRDGVTIALSDGEVHPAEEEWLRHVARENGLSSDGVTAERERLRSLSTAQPLEADGLVIHHGIK